MPEHSHRYEFGAPRGGWPRFGPDGMRIRDEEPDAPRCASCGEVLGNQPGPGDPAAAATGAAGDPPVDGGSVHTCSGSTVEEAI